MTHLSSFQEAMDFLYENLPMFQRQGAPAMKKDLGNIRKLCAAIGNPQDKFQSIHVGGTNGKGSVTHILSALLQSQGYSVGVYTSPHYRDFRERIKINTELVPKKWVLGFLNKHMELIQDIRPSFFEITVAMAFQYFAEQKVELAIIEVGLGGRLDSTNILSPLISVITNISKDHTQFLGDTLVAIAGEKAGIIKAETPVVIGEKQEEVIQVFVDKAEEMNAPLSIASTEIEVRYNHENKEVFTSGIDPQLRFTAEWFTDYQEANLATALKTFQIFVELKQIKVDWLVASSYLESVPEKSYFLGRWMILSHDPTILVDSAHNEAGLAILHKKLSNMKYDKLHCVLGFSNDKDLTSVLPYFDKSARYYFAKADIPRGLDATKLHHQATGHGLNGRAYVSVKNAIKAAKRRANKTDLIYIGGSIFVVAEAL